MFFGEIFDCSLCSFNFTIFHSEKYEERSTLFERKKVLVKIYSCNTVTVVQAVLQMNFIQSQFVDIVTVNKDLLGLDIKN